MASAADTEMSQLADEQERDLRPVANPFGALRPVSQAGGGVAIAQSREVAQVLAAMQVAQQFPRDRVVAMDRVLNAFSDPHLAETALYEYGKGGTEVSDLSIRAAEAIAQEWGHIHMGVRELEEKDGMTLVEAFAFDGQTGTRDSRTFHVKHWRDTRSGGYKLEDRRDVYELVANLAARRKRAAILTVIPQTVKDAVKRQIQVTLRTKVEITPDLLKSLEAKFGEFNVPVTAIEAKIQRRMDAITPAQVLMLGRIYNSLKDGMSEPAQWFDMAPSAESAGKTAEGPKRGAAGLKEAARGKGTSAPAASTSGPAAGPTTPADGPLTFAQVREAIERANDPPTIDAAMALLPRVADEGQRAELDVNARAKKKAIGAALDQAAAKQEKAPGTGSVDRGTGEIFESPK